MATTTTTKRPYTRKPIPAELQKRQTEERDQLKKRHRDESAALSKKHARERQAWRASERAKKNLPQLQAALDRKRAEAAALAAQIAAANGDPIEQPVGDVPAHSIHCSRCDTDVPLTPEEARVSAAAQRVLRQHRSDGCAPRRLPTR